MKQYALAACLWIMLGTAAFSASEPAEKPEPDPRLDQKVTIKAVGKPLGDFLREVTAQTGVKFSARKDAADIKVAVFIKDVPLSSLRDALKDCLHLMCTREGKKDEWTYSFWEDMKTRQDAERIKQEEVEKLHAHVDMLAKQLAEIEAEGKDPAWEFDRLTPEQREKLIHENPDRHAAYSAFRAAAGGGVLPAVTAYNGLRQAQIQALWAGQKVTIRRDQMPADLEGRFGVRADEFINRARHHEWGFRGEQTGDPEVVGGVTLSLEMTGWHNNPCLRYTFDYISDKGEITGGVSSVISMPLEEHRSEPIEPTSADKGPHTRPDLKLKIESKTTLYEVMVQVFELTGTCMISDYYTRMKQPGIITHILTGDHPPFKTADDVLEQAAKDIQSDLSKSGDVRIISSKSWPSNRDREIPERLLVKWRAARKQYGGVRIQDAFEMANLSKLQLEDLELYKTGYGWAVLIHQAAIRVAASLTAGQWQAAMSEAGLSTSQMSDGQLALVQAWGRESETVNGELSDPQRLRSYVVKIIYKGHGEQDDDIKAQWEFELYPPSWRSASEAASRGEGSFAVPSPECRGYIRLADLNQERGWPSPSDEKGEGAQVSK